MAVSPPYSPKWRVARDVGRHLCICTLMCLVQVDHPANAIVEHAFSPFAALGPRPFWSEDAGSAWPDLRHRALDGWSVRLEILEFRIVLR
jgi:hypothetical protein